MWQQRQPPHHHHHHHHHHNATFFFIGPSWLFWDLIQPCSQSIMIRLTTKQTPVRSCPLIGRIFNLAQTRLRSHWSVILTDPTIDLLPWAFLAWTLKRPVPFLSAFCNVLLDAMWYFGVYLLQIIWQAGLANLCGLTRMRIRQSKVQAGIKTWEQEETRWKPRY